MCIRDRNFLFQTAQRLFPDHLCNDLTLRLVCDCIFIVEGLSIGKIFENAVQQRISIVAVSYTHLDVYKRQSSPCALIRYSP